MEADQSSRRGRFTRRLVNVILIFAAIAGIAATVVTYTQYLMAVRVLEEEREIGTREAVQQATNDHNQMEVATQQWQAQEAANSALTELLSVQLLVATEQAVGLDANEAAQLQSTVEALQVQLGDAQATLTPGGVQTEEIAGVIEASTSTPTQTSVPTDTPIPTDTPTPPPTVTPLPTFTPTPISIPQFRDTFDTGFQPEWHRQGENWAVVNGQLTNISSQVLYSSARVDELLQVGDETWANYSVQLDFIRPPNSGQARQCSLGFLITEEKVVR